MKIVLCGLMFWFMSIYIYPIIINVPAGQSTIQAGISAATNTDTVLVQPGTYMENINYNGKLITVGSLYLTTQDTSYISSTIIDGDSSGKVVTFVNSEDSTAVLCGFTITNGYASGGNYLGYGGGIYCQHSSPTMKNLNVIDNCAEIGGGIGCNNCDPIILNVSVIENDATQFGGGIYCQHSSPIMKNLEVIDNSAESGGGIYCYYSNPSIFYVSVIDNNVTQSGGGINCQYSSPIIKYVVISNNSSRYGGGLYFDNSNPILDKVTITANHSIQVGGGVYCRESAPSLQNVILHDNTASFDGGGIFSFSYSNLTLNNSISYNNSPDELHGLITATYSNIKGGFTGTGNIDSDPLFVDTANGDFQLQPESPCIDAGDPASPLDPDGTRADIGTYYYDQILNPISPIADFTVNTTIGSTPLALNFTDLSIHGVFNEWLWDFGNGNSSTLQNPINEYLLPGTYTVSLTVTDIVDSTDTQTKQDYIYVYPGRSIWNISTNGSDETGDGSLLYPFATIQNGIDVSSSTDTVLVQPGTYFENINLNRKQITLSSLYLTTQDTSYISSTIIDGNNSGSVVSFVSGEDNSTEVIGFTITNGSGNSTILPGFTLGGGIICYQNSYPKIMSCVIYQNSATYGGGITCYQNSDAEIMNCVIKQNISGYGGGISCHESSSPNLESILICNNSSEYFGGGIYCRNGSSPVLKNTTISCNTCDNSNGEIIYSYLSSYPFLVNSILWNELQNEIWGSVNVTYSNIRGGETGAGNIDSDPLFVDAENGDFHLMQESPSIDTGDPTSSLDPDETRADMGAYYYDQILNPIPPVADFTADITNGQFPLMANFTDLSMQGLIDEWLWNFGDGNSSTLQNPTNEYLLPGIYTVSLTVTDINDSTDTETKQNYIIVYPGRSVWNISTTGSDETGDGSTQYPLATIQHGINTSSNSDTILVQPGTYIENINFSGKSLTAGSLFLTTQDTSFISSTIIDGNSSGSVVTFPSYESSNSFLSGFTIQNGSASNGGGIYCHIFCSPIIENVIITGNFADSGGGIYCMYSNPLLENVTIAGNVADLGGGIYCYLLASPMLKNVTISNNTAYVEGGGIYNYRSNFSIKNSIIWNNSPQEFEIYSGSISATYSDIKGGWTGTGNIDSDPLFVDPINGDYHLQLSSSCIDAGDPTSPLDPDSTLADMGAYYFHQVLTPDSPQNVSIEVSETDVQLSWDVVSGATAYKVYSSADPYIGFLEDTSGSFVGVGWSAPIDCVKKYYYIKALNDTELRSN